MQNEISDILRYKNLLPSLGEYILREETSWGDDSIPPVMLFSIVGECIYDSYNISEESRRELFFLIERDISSSDIIIRTAAATGLLETIVNKVGLNKEMWNMLKVYLGKNSLEYIEEWNAIYGITM